MTILECPQPIRDGERFDGTIISFEIPDQFEKLAFALVARGRSLVTGEAFREGCERFRKFREASLHALKESGIDFDEQDVAALCCQDVVPKAE